MDLRRGVSHHRPSGHPPLLDIEEVEDPAEQSIEDHDAAVRSTHMFQGQYFDRETNIIWMRNRAYHVKLGRFLTRDPNGTGLALATVLARNAETMSVSSGLSIMDQHGDGMNLYIPFGNNPLTNSDPTGLTATTTAEVGVSVGAGTIIYGSVASAVSSAEAWMLGIIGKAVAYSYISSAAVVSAASATAYALDPAAMAAFESEFVRWMSDQRGRHTEHINRGFNQYMDNASTGGSGMDPNRFKDLLNRLPDLKNLRFSDGALKGMTRGNVHRSVVEDVLKNGTRIADPKGHANTWMYSREIWVNGKMKVVDVLWNADENVIWHVLLKNVK